jgi:repressor LexA
MYDERAFVNPELRSTTHEQMFDHDAEHAYASGMAPPTRRPGTGARNMTGTPASLTKRQKHILDVIETSMRERGYPPSVREIGESVGLTSPSTVHTHLASLERMGYLRRDPTKPRALEVRYDPSSGAPIERRPVRHVPLVGDVAAGTDVLAQENVEELFPLPEDFTGTGELFMLRVRGDSMIDAGILDGDFVVCRSQPSADNGELVVAGIPGGEATVKTYERSGGTITLRPANERLSPMVYDADEVEVFGRVVTVMRRL